MKEEVSMKISFSFLLLLLGSALSSPVPEVKESNDHLLYPYGASVGDMKNPKDDDGTSPEITTKSDFTFYGKTFRKIFVNNNGVVSFGVPVPEYTPEAIPLVNGKPFVAPYWGDVNNILGGDIWYREVNGDPEMLQQITKDIHQYFPNIPFTCTGAFIATWDHVAYFGSVSKKANTFQAVLITDGHISFIMLNYGDIQWTTGAASGGDRRTGLGGIPAQAGFNSGDDKNYYSIPGSRTAHIVNITKTSNVHVPGRWVFQVDTFKVTGVPEELQRLKEEEEKKAKSNEDQGPPSNEAEIATTRNPPEAEGSNVSQVNEVNSEVERQEVKAEQETVPSENLHKDEQTQANQDNDVNPEIEQEAKVEPETVIPESGKEEEESQVNQVYENREEKESQKQEENEDVSAVDVPELPVQKPELVPQINDDDEDDCEW